MNTEQKSCPHCKRNEEECEKNAEGEMNPITEWCGWGLSCDDCYYKNHPESDDEEEEGSTCAECGISTAGRKIRGLWDNVLCEECGEHSDIEEDEEEAFRRAEEGGYEFPSNQLCRHCEEKPITRGESLCRSCFLSDVASDDEEEEDEEEEEEEEDMTYCDNCDCALTEDTYIFCFEKDGEDDMTMCAECGNDTADEMRADGWKRDDDV